MPQLPSYDYYKKVFSGKSLPFAFVDMDLLDENIKQVAKRVGGKPVRIASKSIRCSYILRYILSQGAPFKGIMCYSAEEAAMLAATGFDDILIGYPSWENQHVEHVCRQVRQGKQIVLMIDSVEHVEHLSGIAQQEGVTLSVCMDVDMSTDFPGLYFGVYRSPIRTAEAAVDLYRKLQQHPNLKLVGIMGYEAQIAGIGNATPGKRFYNQIVGYLQKRSIAKVADRRRKVVEALQSEGAQLQLVNAGGTGSLESSAAEDWVTEVTAGSAFFSPGLFDYYRHFHHKPAAAFAIQVVRQPRKGMVTGLGGGYIASGSTGAEKQPVPYLPKGLKMVKNEGAGEVQTPFYTNGISLNIGDPIFMRHSKAGELCERFNKLYLVRDGQISKEVLTYRGEGWCFL